MGCDGLCVEPDILSLAFVTYGTKCEPADVEWRLAGCKANVFFSLLEGMTLDSLASFSNQLN